MDLNKPVKAADTNAALDDQASSTLDHQASSTLDHQASSTLDDAVRAEQIRLLVENHLDRYLTLLIAAIVIAVVWPVYPPWLLAAWFGLSFGAVLVRSWLGFRFRAAPRDAAAVRRWAVVFSSGAAVTGILWGCAGSIPLVTSGTALQYFSVMITGGMMAGGVMVDAAYFPAMAAFSVPAVVPGILILFSRGDLRHIGMGVLLSLFSAVIMTAALKLNRVIVQNIQIRFQNIQIRAGHDALLAKVQSSEAGMAEAQRLAKAGSWDIDLATGVITLSPEGYNVFGFTPADDPIPFANLLARIHPDDLERVNSHVAGSVTQSAATGIDFRMLAAGGAIKYVNVTPTTIFDADGHALRIIGSVQDITERRRTEEQLQFANLVLKTQMEASPDGILVADRNRRAAGFNRRFAEMWRIPAAAMVNPDDDAIRALMTAQLKDPMAYRARQDFLHNHSEAIADEELVMADGRIFSCYSRALLSAEGQHLGRVWFYGDITESRAAERNLQFANVMMKTQMEASPDGIIAIGANRRVLSFNQRFADMWNIPVPQLAASDGEALRTTLAGFAKDAPGVFVLAQHFLDHPDETHAVEFETNDGRFIELHSRTLHGQAAEGLGRIWFFRDVTTRRTAEALALRLARYDVLTGLANRAVFVEAVQHAIASAKRGGPGFAVLYLDLDHFKNVNDTLGHPAGDALLKEVAARLRANTRETDTVGRFGGDEFAIVASGIKDPADAAALAEKLIAAINTPFRIEGNDIHTAASIGIDLYSPGANDVETLLAHADVALYRSKADGRGIYRFFTAAMDRQVRARVTLGYELREAVARNELFLVYQPQVDVATGRITGIEALVRWRHPTRGVLTPGYFIPVSEATGTIGQIGNFVLWQACRQAKDWIDAGFCLPRIAVNISALQFKTPAVLEADILAALAATGLPPHVLELELTESVLMAASRERDTILRRLRELGVKLAIDDFGTGYSSLDYLRRFPVDHLKISHSFTRHVESGAGETSIVRAIIGLAHELNIGVIVEGVETKSQLELLKSWNCGEVQGFYFARPMEAKDIAPLLSHEATIHPAPMPRYAKL
jgi:diguanylate cyclase (GGDEF)-like protein/PAS domain S-box-containing protein